MARRKPKATDPREPCRYDYDDPNDKAKMKCVSCKSRHSIFTFLRPLKVVLVDMRNHQLLSGLALDDANKIAQETDWLNEL